jgi:glycosyltransferase involved in cell wall biosynthesis
MSKAMIYPSHMDAYPFAVLESLKLGTPVVSYRIPAILFNFNECIGKGITFVDECNFRELAIEVANLLDEINIRVVEPYVRSLNEIIEEEVQLLYEYLVK